jgi:flagellar basal body-associated protein FliL
MHPKRKIALAILLFWILLGLGVASYFTHFNIIECFTPSAPTKERARWEIYEDSVKAYEYSVDLKKNTDRIKQIYLKYFCRSQRNGKNIQEYATRINTEVIKTGGWYIFSVSKFNDLDTVGNYMKLRESFFYEDDIKYCIDHKGDIK